jgi:hypothetical protein
MALIGSSQGLSAITALLDLRDIAGSMSFVDVIADSVTASDALAYVVVTTSTPVASVSTAETFDFVEVSTVVLDEI